MTKTPQRTFYSSKVAQNKPYYVGNCKSAILLVTVKTGALGGFLTFFGSAQDAEIDITQPASQANHYSRVAVYDADTGKMYEGSIGISVATARVLTLEVNTEFLAFLAVDDSFKSSADVNIDIVCTY